VPPRRCKCERRNDRENPNHPARRIALISKLWRFINDKCRRQPCSSIVIVPQLMTYADPSGSGSKITASEGWTEVRAQCGPAGTNLPRHASSLSNFRFSEMSGHIAVDDRLARPGKSSCRAAALLHSCDDCWAGERKRGRLSFVCLSD